MKAKIKRKTETKDVVVLRLKMTEEELTELYGMVHSAVVIGSRPLTRENIRSKICRAIQDLQDGH